MIIMQYTKLSSGIDIYVNDDDSVTEIDGTPLPDAVVRHNPDGSISVDLDDRGIDDIQPYPSSADIKVTREEGWQGNLGWRAELLDWDETREPTNMAIGVYALPEGKDYQFTTGKMQWDAENDVYFSICPPGFEPGQADVHFSMLYGSLQHSSFTLFANFDEMVFAGVGGPGV